MQACAGGFEVLLPLLAGDELAAEFVPHRAAVPQNRSTAVAQYRAPCAAAYKGPRDGVSPRLGATPGLRSPRASHVQGDLAIVIVVVIVIVNSDSDCDSNSNSNSCPRKGRSPSMFRLEEQKCSRHLRVTGCAG